MGQIHMKHRTDWDPEVFFKKKPQDPNLFCVSYESIPL